MANVENLKPFNEENAKEMGIKGGIASGKSRRKKAHLQKCFQTMFNISLYLNSLGKSEFNNFISDFTMEQQKNIKKLFNIKKY